MMNLFALYRYDLKDVTGAIFSSVVPPINFMMTKALTRLLGEPPMVVGPGVKTGLNIRMEVHNQLGADLVANAVAALEKYAPPIIMIDMGTATTISYISAKRSYEGGLMFPGVRLSLDALSDHTAQLPDISLQHPKQLIGKNTEDCMRSGIVYGTAGMLDGIIDRIREMLPGEQPTIVATGSNAPVIVRYCRNKVYYDKYLLMNGLWAIYQKNEPQKSPHLCAETFAVPSDQHSDDERDDRISIHSIHAFHEECDNLSGVMRLSEVTRGYPEPTRAQMPQNGEKLVFPSY